MTDTYRPEIIDAPIISDAELFSWSKWQTGDGGWKGVTHSPDAPIERRAQAPARHEATEISRADMVVFNGLKRQFE